METIYTELVDHYGVQKLLLRPSNYNVLLPQIRGIYSARYSATKSGWLISLDKRSTDMLFELGKNVELKGYILNYKNEKKPEAEDDLASDTIIVKGNWAKIEARYANPAAIKEIMKIPGAHKTNKPECYIFPNNESNLALIKRLLNANSKDFDTKKIIDEKTQEIESEISTEKKNALLKFKYWLKSKRYSENTVETYLDHLSLFFRFYNSKPIYKITNNDIIVFNNDYVIRRGLSVSFQNQLISAVKLFYSRLQDKEMDLEQIERARRSRQLPKVLSKEEVAMLLSSIRNMKHKTMLSLIYSCGLRRSELLNLTVKDVDSKRKLLYINKAKGNRDRVVPLSEKILEALRVYYRAYKPVNWLFEGEQSGEQYSESSLQNLFRIAVLRCRIKRKITLHCLRHSYATHLLEAGTDLRYIQELLGHKSSRTTEIYTHVSMRSIQNIKNPFDDLDVS